MPKISCKGGCGNEVRNPPSYNITGYCAECLGLAHKKAMKKLFGNEERKCLICNKPISECRSGD